MSSNVMMPEQVWVKRRGHSYWARVSIKRAALDVLQRILSNKSGKSVYGGRTVVPGENLVTCRLASWSYPIREHDWGLTMRMVQSGRGPNLDFELSTSRGVARTRREWADPSCFYFRFVLVFNFSRIRASTLMLDFVIDDT